MSSNASENPLQSKLLLPIARIYMLLLCSLAFVTVIVALAISAVSFAVSGNPPPQQIASVVEIGPNDVAFLTAPKPSLVVTLNASEGINVREGSIFGEVKSGGKSQISKVDIVAGSGVKRFAIGRAENKSTFVIYATDRLASELANNVPEKRLEYEITLIGIDAFNQATEPYKANFTLPGTKSASNTPVESQQPEPNSEFSAEEPTGEALLAADIALVADPTRSPKYFDIYEKLLDRIIFLKSKDSGFLGELRVSFDKYRNEFTSSTAPLFVDRYSEIRKRKIQETLNARSRAEQEHLNYIATATASKERGIFWLYIFGASIGTFITLALALALLAIENHLKHIRLSLVSAV